MVREDPLVGALFALRSIPDQVMRRLGRAPHAPEIDSMRLRDLGAEGEWIRLAEDPDRDLVFGATGRFSNGPIVLLRSVLRAVKSRAESGGP